MKKILLILAALVPVMLSSCAGDNGEAGKISKGTGFKLNYVVAGHEGQAATRAMAISPEPGEETVQSLYLLFFESSGNGTGQFLNYYKVGGTLAMNQDININFQDGGLGTAGEQNLNNNTDYNILAIANIFDDVYFSGTAEDWLNSFLGSNEAQVADNAKLVLSGTSSNTDYSFRAIESDQLPMSGSFTKTHDSERASAELTRIVSRFDIHNKARETWDLVSASVWNAYGSTNISKSGFNDFTEARIKRLYGVKSEAGGNGNDGHPIAGDIMGKLYSFENFVSSPDGRDTRTTCIIVGMAKRDGNGNLGAVTYHRANINPTESSQYLKRNNVYKLTINNVIGNGAPDEETAYTQNDNMIDYVINSWDLDDNGMVLIDGNNTLVVPVKKLKLSPEGEVREISIFTMGEGTLTMSRTQLDSGISAVLVGNRLTITAAAMDFAEEERKGTVVLSFGSLDATIDIIQTRNEDLFLTLNKSSIVEFPAYSPGMAMLDGDIVVSASGSWKAKIFNPTVSGTNRGFSFDQIALEPPVTEITSADVSDNRIKIYTTGSNESNERRYAFVIVTLDADEEINRSLVLAQKPATGIIVKPEAQTTITFSPTGVLSGNATFTVEPGEDGLGTQLNAWKVELIGTGSDNFRIDDLVCNTNPGDIQKFTVASKGINNTGSNLRPQVKISLVGSPDTFVLLNIVQDRAEWRIIAPSAAIPATGGMSGDIIIDAAAGLTYKVEVTSLTPSTLSGHFAYLVDESGNKYSNLKVRDVSRVFKVGFPKLIYPNTGVSPQATVTVTLIETGESKSVVITQSAVTQYATNILNVGTSYGRLANSSGSWSSSYNLYYVSYLSNASYFGPSGTVRTNGAVRVSTNDSPGTISASTRYVHYSRPNTSSNSTRDGNINNFINSNEGIVVISNDDNGSRNSSGAFSSNRLPGMLGLVGSSGDPNGTFGLNNEVAYRNGNFMQYLIKDGPWGNKTSAFSDWTSASFTAAANTSAVTRSSLLAAWEHAIPIISNGSNVILACDPVRNIVFTGDAEIFQGSGYDATISSTKERILGNLLAYIVNAAQYGSHFTDYFWPSDRMQLTAPTPEP